jgi:hypothetical protein
VNASADLVTVPFYGDELQALRDGERVLVALRSMCDGLGVDFSAQLVKLRSLEAQGLTWAKVGMATVATPGGIQQVACLCLDGVPMWLTTIALGRVAPGVKAKLVRYQNEAAKVLADAFLRPASSAVAVLDPQTLAVIERVAVGISQPIVAALTRLEDTQAAHGKRLANVETMVTTLQQALKHRRKHPAGSVRAHHIEFCRFGPPGTDHCCWCRIRPLFNADGEFSGNIHHHDAASDAVVGATMAICGECNQRCNREPMPRCFIDAYHQTRKAWLAAGGYLFSRKRSA